MRGKLAINTNNSGEITGCRLDPGLFFAQPVSGLQEAIFYVRPTGLTENT